MTQADIYVNGEGFFVMSDGMDKKEIKDTIKYYIKQASSIVKHPKYIADIAISKMIEDAEDYYNWFQRGSGWKSEYTYIARIDDTGKLSFHEEE